MQSWAAISMVQNNSGADLKRPSPVVFSCQVYTLDGRMWEYNSVSCKMFLVNSIRRLPLARLTVDILNSNRLISWYIGLCVIPTTEPNNTRLYFGFSTDIDAVTLTRYFTD